jgi:hypothetical protein
MKLPKIRLPMNANKLIKRLLSALILFFCCQGFVGYAQLKGDHLLGDFGLGAATQPPPTIIAALPFYGYNASRLRNSSGDVITDDLNVNAFLVGAGGSVVTDFKILNANYGATVLLAFMSNRLEGNEVQTSIPLGFSDMYIQPLQLGWHAKRADYMIGYGIYMPTGTYEVGGDSNTGLGMWGHEFSAGTTLFFDPKKTLSFSAMAFYETHSRKKDSEIKVSDILSIEGGLGKTFYKHLTGSSIPIVISAGAVYYLQYKVSDDRVSIGDATFSGDKDQIYAWGLEANVFHPTLRTSLSIRWFDEFGAQNRFEGNTFLLNLAYIIDSLEGKED